MHQVNCPERTICIIEWFSHNSATVFQFFSNVEVDQGSILLAQLWLEIVLRHPYSAKQNIALKKFRPVVLLGHVANLNAPCNTDQLYFNLWKTKQHWSNYLKRELIYLFCFYCHKHFLDWIVLFTNTGICKKLELSPCLYARCKSEYLCLHIDS